MFGAQPNRCEIAANAGALRYVVDFCPSLAFAEMAISDYTACSSDEIHMSLRRAQALTLRTTGVSMALATSQPRRMRVLTIS